MAILSNDQAIAALASAQRMVMQKASITSVAGFYYSLWATAPNAGSMAIGNTTAGVVPTDATPGAPVIKPFTGTNTGYLMSFDASFAQAGILSVYDRLWHAGTFLTTSLQTYTMSGNAVVTRVPNNDYSCLELWLEQVVANTSAATTVVVTYTDGNDATQTATLDTNIASNPANRMLPFRLANSSGIKKVLTVVVGGATSTGTFNVMIQRNIVDHTTVSPSIGRPKKNYFDTGLQQVYTDSCLSCMCCATYTQTGFLFAEAAIGNG